MRVEVIDDCHTAADALARAQRAATMRRHARVPPPDPQPQRPAPVAVVAPAPRPWPVDENSVIELPNFLALRYPGVPNPEIEATRSPSVQSIIAACADYFGVDFCDVVSVRRTGNVMKPRQIAMYLCKKLTPRSLPDIGRRFGPRDHTTILHGVKKITGLVATDHVLAGDVAAIEAKIAGARA